MYIINKQSIIKHFNYSNLSWKQRSRRRTVVFIFWAFSLPGL